MRKIKVLMIGITGVILLFSCSSNKRAVTEENVKTASFNGEWKLKDSWVFDSTLVFHRVDKTIERPEYEEVFIINDTNLTHSIRTELGLCGNGLFYLDSASFVNHKKNVRMKLNGGQMMESTFIYSADYTIKEQTADKFVLVLEQVNLFDSSSIYD